uniref:Uncharacterized protein n=1 Tax=Plectus sambesii TaxID=2011161 RepID=A0A914XNL0_9BILA
MNAEPSEAAYLCSYLAQGAAGGGWSSANIGQPLAGGLIRSRRAGRCPDATLLNEEARPVKNVTGQLVGCFAPSRPQRRGERGRQLRRPFVHLVDRRWSVVYCE